MIGHFFSFTSLISSDRNKTIGDHLKSIKSGEDIVGMQLGYKKVVNDFEFLTSSGSFYSALDKLFGIPCTIDYRDIPKLEGMEACGFVEARELIAAINLDGAIEVAKLS